MENIIGGSHSIVIPSNMHKYYTKDYNPDKICKVSIDINYELVISRFLNSKTENRKKCKKYFSYIETESLVKLTNNREFVKFVCSLPEFLKINRVVTDFYYFTMDYAGKDLFEICIEPEPELFQSENNFKSMVKQLFKGISFLHGLNVCHFDIKPENITYCAYTKHFKYIDFGYAEMYPFIGYINNGPRGTLDYIPITYNAYDKAKMKWDLASPYVECNDWSPRDESIYNSKYVFYNKLYPELCYKAETFALGKTIYYIYYYYQLRNETLSLGFKMGLEALIFDLINNDIMDRPYICNVAFKKYFKIQKTRLEIAPKFGSREYLYTDHLTADYGTRLLEAYGSSSTVSTITSAESCSSNSLNPLENASDDSDASDSDSITSLEIQNNSRNCLSKLRINFSFKKLISFLL